MNFLVATNFDDVFSRRAQNPYMKATPADETGAHWEVYLVRRELDLTVADGILGEIRRMPN